MPQNFTYGILYVNERKKKALKIKNQNNSKKWKDIPCSWIERMNTVKMAILPKAINRFNTIPIKLPMAFLYGTIKDPVLPKQSWAEKKAGGITLPDFREY